MKESFLKVLEHVMESSGKFEISINEERDHVTYKRGFVERDLHGAQFHLRPQAMIAQIELIFQTSLRH